jgi:hypothetical protein
MIKLILLFFVYSINLFSNEIIYLPAEVKGSIPKRIESVTFYQKELGTLSNFYLTENFIVETTSQKVLSDFLQRNPELISFRTIKTNYKKICEEFGVNYVAKDFFAFGDVTVVGTDLYNCLSGDIDRFQTKLEKMPEIDLEDHIKKGFKFLRVRAQQDRKLINEHILINVFLDGSGPLQTEKETIQKFLMKYVDQQNVSLGIIHLSQNKEEVLKPISTEPQKKKFIQDLKYRGINDLNNISQSILNLKKISPLRPTDQMYNIFFISSQYHKYDITLDSLLREYSNLGYKNIIISGNFYDTLTNINLKKLSNSVNSEYFEITHHQKVEFSDQIFSLFLKENNIYVNESENDSPPFDFNQTTWKKIPLRDLLVYSENINQYNFSEVFSKYMSKKIIKKEELKSDLEYYLDNLLNRNSYSLLPTTKLLIQKDIPIWISLKKIETDFNEEYVTIKTMMKKDNQSSTGYSNIYPLTSVLKPTAVYPKLLDFGHSSILEFFKNYPNKNLKVFVSGKILETKNDIR